MFIYKHYKLGVFVHEKSEVNFSTSDFLNRIQSRDTVAIELLVRTYTESLYKGALGLGFDVNSAEELVQSVWTTFFDIAHGFQGRSHVRTFIFGILYNKASELRRENKRHNGNSESIDDVFESKFSPEGSWVKPPIDPEQFLMASETMDLIIKCLDNLPLSQRMAFCLKEIDDHGSNDICNILNVTVTNLGVLLFRARNKLRECIESKARLKAN